MTKRRRAPMLAMAGSVAVVCALAVSSNAQGPLPDKLEARLKADVEGRQARPNQRLGWPTGLQTWGASPVRKVSGICPTSPTLVSVFSVLMA